MKVKVKNPGIPLPTSQSTYHAVPVGVPQQTGPVTPGRVVEVDDQRVHTVWGETQALEVVPHRQLQCRWLNRVDGLILVWNERNKPL